MDKIRVGVVNYLNTLPLLYGIRQSPFMQQVELVPDYPSRIADFLKQGAVDVGFIPAAVIPEITSGQIISSYCISSDGPVASVCLMSKVPLQEIECILLDYQSRTSVALLKLLCRDHWKLKVRFVEAKTEFQEEIQGTTAGLLIGDRCLDYRSRAPYIYDLGEAWKSLTGLPFVFAVWVSRIALPATFVAAFDEAQAEGLRHLDEVVSAAAYPSYDLHRYYTENIHYVFGERQKRALSHFLDSINEHALL